LQALFKHLGLPRGREKSPSKLREPSVLVCDIRPDSTSPLVCERYSAVAILLHWGIAATLVLQIFLGWRLEGEEAFVRSGLLRFHKSIGISILALTLARLLWRFWKRPPPRRNRLKPIEQTLVQWVHAGFYVVLLALPLSGWAMVSIRSTGMFQLFGFVPWPHLPLVSLLSEDGRQALSDNAGSVHALMTRVTIALLALHVTGALKHHFISKDGTVGRMLPGIPSGAVGWRFLAVPVVATLLGAIVYLVKPSVPAPRPKPTNLERADLFLDVVEPALEQRCGSCHSEDDAHGGLSVSNYDSLMQGGRSGRSVVSRQPLASELFRRISLPAEDPKFMPRNGRRPLTAAQISAIRLWIEAGASATNSVAALHLSEEQSSMLQRLLGGSGAPEELRPLSEPLPVVAKADTQAVTQLVEQGFVIRKVSRSSELLVVDFTGRGRITDAAWSALTRIAAQTRSLNLYNAGVTDETLSGLGDFVNLNQLRLESNPIGDDGVAHLTSLRGLVSLNLVNTKVGDLGVTKLAALPMLRRLYTWRSLVSPAKIAILRQGRPDLELIAGVGPDNIEVKKEPAGAPN
jgi:cytochrome b561